MQSYSSVREEKLSFSEKWELRKRFLFVLLFGACIASVLYYVVIVKSIGSGIPIPAIIFVCFFFLVLAFILFVHARNAFQTTKRIYSGIITDKEELTSKFKNELGQTRYSIQLNNETFHLDLRTFNQLAKGEHVELHVLTGNQVFKAVPFTVKPIFHSEILRTDKLDEKYHPVLRKIMLRRLFFYGLLGFIGVRILLFIAQFCIVILMKDIQRWSDLFQLANLLALVIYLVLNWKTIQLVRDWFSKMQVTQSDIVVDLLKSNLPKSTKNSIQTYQGYWYKNDTFYYVQTSKYWVQISEENYIKLNNGAAIKVVRLMYSKIVLEVEI
jgi:hypothetical protein